MPGRCGPDSAVRSAAIFPFYEAAKPSGARFNRYRSSPQSGPTLTSRSVLPAAQTAILPGCRPGDSEAQLLLDSGVLDVFGESRPAMFWQLRKLVRRANQEPATLWSNADDNHPQFPPVELTPPNRRRVAQREMELLGFPVTIDPLTYLGENENGKAIDWSRYAPVSEMENAPDGA